MAASAADLDRIQRWFHAAITHPGGTAEGLHSDTAREFYPDAGKALDAIVLPSKALTSLERLSIYANMYFDRLIDILGEEFPSVRHLLGPREFADAVTGYLSRHPPSHYSLAQLGSEFPRYLEDESGGRVTRHRAFAAAVATVERTVEDVFDERQDDAVGIEEIRAIGPDRWDRVRLDTISALRLLEVPYPVNNYISGVRDGRQVDVADARPSFMVVHRRNYRVWRTDLDEQRFVLLSELRAGRTLGAALGTCAELPNSDPETLAASLYTWFRDWAAEGYFRKVQVNSPAR